MLDLLRQRRSIRTYKNQTISAEQMKLLSEALLRAPSSRDLQPCEFILVNDPDILKQLVNAKAHGTSFLQPPHWQLLLPLILLFPMSGSKTAQSLQSLFNWPLNNWV